MILSICIPTYNRCEYLMKNLNQIIKIIKENNLEEKIEVVISNNNSKDSTNEKVKKFKNENDKIKINYFNQRSDLAIQKNLLFTIEKSVGKYIMWLGDDDFFSEAYLLRVINEITTNQLGAIIPSFMSIDIDGNELGEGRDLNKASKLYKKGFDNCLENSWRGHQMSGLVFERKESLSNYKKNKVDNIYPFIYFAAFNSLNSKTLHLTEFPIKVTQPGQQKKYWDYGEDGLISEIFDNYKKLNLINSYQRFLLEMKILQIQSWRYTQYRKNMGKAIYEIIVNKNTSISTKIIFPIYLLMIFPYKLFRKISRKLCL